MSPEREKIVYYNTTDPLFQIEEQSFQDCIWPVLKNRIKPLPELSLETLHFVLLARALYPHVVKKKFLHSHIGTSEIINEDSVWTCAKLLMVSAVFVLSNELLLPLLLGSYFPSHFHIRE
jgi:hypothetical protein